MSLLRRNARPAGLTVVIHAAVLAALWWVSPPDETPTHHEVDFEVVPPPRPEPEEPAPPPPTRETPAHAPEVTPPPAPHPAPRPAHPHIRAQPPPAPSPPAPGPSGEPAPGPVTTPNADSPYQLGMPTPAAQAQAPGGTGPGGTGGGHGNGSGAPGDTPGTGGAPAPVSVAAIKTMPQPIGDTDFVEAHKDYPAEATQLGIQGQVKVRLLVDDRGRVVEKKLVTRLGHGLDELALRLAGKLRFRPAIDVHDRPVAATVVWTFNFTIPR